MLKYHSSYFYINKHFHYKHCFISLLGICLSSLIKQPLNLNYLCDFSFSESSLYKMYAISYMWYAVIGTITCVIIGIIVGALTGKESDKFDEKLLHPAVARIYRKIPGSKRTYSTEKTDSEKESSVKTEVTVADDIKSDVNNISEVAPHNNINEVVNTTHKNINSEVYTPYTNLETENNDGFTVVNNNSNVKLKEDNNMTGLSSSNSRLFDAYEKHRRSPSPIRSKK